MKFLILLLLSIFSLFSMAQSSDEEMAKAHLEFLAASHQAFLELEKTPMPEIPAELLAKLKTLNDETKINLDIWNSFPDLRYREALALRMMILQSGGETALADTVTETYLANRGISFKASYLNSALVFPAWSRHIFSSNFHSCNAIFKFQHIPTNTTGTSNSHMESYLINWRQPYHTLSLYISLPQKPKNGYEQIVLSQVYIENQFRDDPLSSVQKVTKITFILKPGGQQIEPVIIYEMPVMTSLLDPTTNTTTRKAIDDGKLVEVAQTKFLSGETMKTESHAGSWDESLGKAEFRYLMTNLTCEQAPINLEKTDIHESILKVISNVNAAVQKQESLRLSWQECLSRMAQKDCDELESNLRRSEADLFETWKHPILQPSDLPAMFFASSSSVKGALIHKSTPALGAPSLPTAPPPVEPVAPPPVATNLAFKIPDRECNYARLGGRTIAQCAGNMACHYDANFTKAKCTDGRTCYKNAQTDEVTCQ